MTTAPRNIDMGKLRNAAEAGDADAQYALAAALSNAGDRREADRWLNASADQGHGDALYTLATRAFYSSQTIDDGAALLQRACEAGSLAARRLAGVAHAEGHGFEVDWAKAVACIIDAARGGDPGAMTEVAMLLFASDPDDANGAALIARAAMQDAGGAAVAVRRAAAGRLHTDTSVAAKALQQLAAVRYPNVAALEKALGALSTPVSYAPADPDWSRIAEQLSAAPPAPAIASETVCERPSARVYRGAFSVEECEYVIAASARLLAPSLIVDPQTGKARRDGYRNSLTAILSLMDLDLAMVMINRRVAALAGCLPEQGEFLSILCYRPGQEYRPHFDWLPPGAEFDRSGQRIATALISFNDGYDGGETHFLTPDIRFKGQAGDLLVFDNVLADGEVDRSSRHAGLPVTNGAKWLGSKWFREKKYNF